MKSNDLSTLFSTQGKQPIEFRQGTILEWNQATGANQVSVGGSILTNVRVLNTGEAIALKPGHVVGILKSGTQWFIVGRISVPESTQFAGASVAFDQSSNTAAGFGLAADAPEADFAVGTLTIPAWATQALITNIVQLDLLNIGNPNANLAYVAARIQGNGGYSRSSAYSTLTAQGGQWGSIVVVQGEIMDIVSSTQITTLARIAPAIIGTGWASDWQNLVTVTTLVQYRSTV